MALNKKHVFPEEQQQIAQFAKALSHPARLAILKVLAEKANCICGKIVEVLPLSQATVSQHLKELLQVGIIQGTIDGNKSCYCINWEMLRKFEQQTAQYLSEIIKLTQDQNCC
jgi:ArsR family transcriptional regulator